MGFCSPAFPGESTVLQPDGTEISIRVFGDEWFHYSIDVPSGRLVVPDESGWWRYALVQDQVLRPSGIAVGEPLPENFPCFSDQDALALSAARTKSRDFSRGAPTTGTIQVPVILVNFNDRSTTYTNTHFNNLMFSTAPSEAPYGSVRDYYFEVSYNNLTLQGVVVGWVTAANGHDYYGQNDVWGNDANPRALVSEAVTLADPSVNFSQFDNDGDGYVDMIVVVHQGTGEEATPHTSTDIWSHKWSLPYPGVSVDGVKAYLYMLVPEQLGSAITTVGVIAHEMGHAFGLPDLYDYSNSTFGIGAWGVMAYGGWNFISRNGDCPAHFCAWSKNQLGWLTNTSLNGFSGSKTLLPNETSPSIFSFSNPAASTEYFLLENRKWTGFDRGIPSQGMLVTHVDDTMANNDLGTWPHKLVDVEEADGLNQLDNKTSTGDGGDVFPGSTSNTAFSSTSSPNANWYSGSSSSFSLSSIQKSGDNVSFQVGGGSPSAWQLSINTLPVSNINLLVDSTGYVSPQTLMLSAGNHTVNVLQTLHDIHPMVPGNDARYTFSQWQDASTANPRTINLSSNAVYTANLSTEYWVQTSASPTSLVTIPGSSWYANLSNPLFSAPSVSGYTFSHWIQNGVNMGPANPIGVPVVSPISLVAEFQPLPTRNANLVGIVPKFPPTGIAPFLVKLGQTTGVQQLSVHLTLGSGTLQHARVFLPEWNVTSLATTTTSLSATLNAVTPPYMGQGSVLQLQLSGTPNTYPVISWSATANDPTGAPVPVSQSTRNHLCDLDQNGTVDASDWNLFSSAYGSMRTVGTWTQNSLFSDLNNDDTVGSTFWDIALFGQHSVFQP